MSEARRAPPAVAAASDVVVIVRLRHARRRGGPVRAGRRRRGRGARAASSSTARPSRRRRRAPSPSASREPACRDARRARLRRQRGREEGHPVDLRRRRRADLERARPVLESLGTTITHFGPIGSGQAVKAVNQVILAGHLPRRRGGDRPGAQGRPRRRAGGGGARRRRGAQLGPREPQRPDDRQRLPARVQGRAPPQGPRDRAATWRASSARRCRSRPVRGARGRAHRPGPRRRRHVRPRPRDPRALRARRPRRPAGDLSPGRPAAAGGRADRRSAAGSARVVHRRRHRPGAGRGAGSRQRRLGVLAVADRDHPPELAVGDEVHRDVRERRRDHRSSASGSPLRRS